MYVQEYRPSDLLQADSGEGARADAASCLLRHPLQPGHWALPVRSALGV